MTRTLKIICINLCELKNIDFHIPLVTNKANGILRSSLSMLDNPSQLFVPAPTLPLVTG